MALEQQIASYYEKYLGRTPQAVEVQNWIGTGKSASEIEQGLAQHPTSTYGSQQIQTFYQQSLGRAPVASEIKDWQGTGKSLDQIQQGIAGYAQQNPQAVAKAPPAQSAQQQPVEDSRYKELLDRFDSQQKSFDEQIKLYENRLADERGRFDREREQSRQLQSLYDTQFETARSQYEASLKASSERLSGLQSELSKTSEQAAANAADANRYREEAVGSQLAGLRSGLSRGGGGRGTIGGRGSLASGGGFSTSSGRPLYIDPRAAANDSVLNRKGPVVEAVSPGSGTAPRRSAAAAASGSGSLARGGASSYYARRFG